MGRTIDLDAAIDVFEKRTHMDWDSLKILIPLLGEIEKVSTVELPIKHKCTICPHCNKCDVNDDGTLLSVQPEQDMVDDLISFIEREKGKENRTLADWTVQWILEDIIAGKCKITGSATDHKKKKMYVEFSFYQEEQDEQKN